MLTRYDAMNGGAKCRKWGSLGQLGGTQGHRQCHHSIKRIRLPIRSGALGVYAGIRRIPLQPPGFFDSVYSPQ